MRAADERLMRLAISIGERNNGRAHPNPSVGAVVVDRSGGTDRIVAIGVTQPGGRPHAEVDALRAAGAEARGATLYVSLEPCSHHGHTPPCADAIVAAGIARVVSALEDPDVRVSGRGHACLRTARIDVLTGVLAQDAERALRGHLTRSRLGRPAIRLKIACTRDGFAAAGPGEERLMISGEGAWNLTHLARAHADAIMVGVSTIVGDDPRLDVRLAGLADRSPIRVVIDTHLRIPLASRVVATAHHRPTWILCGPGAPALAEERLVAFGAVVIRVPQNKAGGVDLAAAMAELGNRGLTRVLCEGGPTLADALAASDLLDEVAIMTGEGRLDRPGRPAIGPHLAGRIDGMRSMGIRTIGSDTIARYERM